jgi:N-acyl-D-aspartate/D-glutamate deacylase
MIGGVGLDLRIVGARVIDGTGAPPVWADVGIRDDGSLPGRILRRA